MSDIPRQVKPRLPGGFSLPPFGIHQFLALVIVCVALWCLGVLWLGVQVSGQWIGSWQQDIRYHVYLAPEKKKELKALAEKLGAIPGVDTVRIVDQSEASRWMRSWLGETGLDAEELARRLPYSIEIIPGQEAGEFLFTDIRDEAERFGASVNDNESHLARTHYWLERIKHLVWFATAILAMAMAIIVSNALRMTLLARAEEIHLMRLLGAREWFVRMPFILEGLMVGSGAGLFAWLLVWPLIFGAAEWFAGMQLQLNAYILLPPLLACGAIVGCLGALIATMRVVSPESGAH